MCGHAWRHISKGNSSWTSQNCPQMALEDSYDLSMSSEGPPFSMWPSFKLYLLVKTWLCCQETTNRAHRPRVFDRGIKKQTAFIDQCPALLVKKHNQRTPFYGQLRPTLLDIVELIGLRKLLGCIEFLQPPWGYPSSLAYTSTKIIKKHVCVSVCLSVCVCVCVCVLDQSLTQLSVGQLSWYFGGWSG